MLDAVGFEGLLGGKEGLSDAEVIVEELNDSAHVDIGRDGAEHGAGGLGGFGRGAHVCCEEVRRGVLQDDAEPLQAGADLAIFLLMAGVLTEEALDFAIALLAAGGDGGLHDALKLRRVHRQRTPALVGFGGFAGLLAIFEGALDGVAHHFVDGPPAISGSIPVQFIDVGLVGFLVLAESREYPKGRFHGCFACFHLFPSASLAR